MPGARQTAFQEGWSARKIKLIGALGLQEAAQADQQVMAAGVRRWWMITIVGCWS